MLKARYASAESDGEKLYISALLYAYMNQHNQPFYGGSSGDAHYQKLETQFIEALTLDGQGQYQVAQQSFIQLLKQMKKQNDETGRLLLKYQLCRSLNEQSRYHQANYYCSILEAEINDIADPVVPKSIAYRVIANNQYFRSDYQAALNTYMILVESFPKGQNISGIYNDLGNLFKEMKQFEKSEHYLKMALELRSESSELQQAQVRHSLAKLYMAQAKHDLAISQFLQAKTLLQSSKHTYGTAITTLGLGRAYTATKQYDLARTYLTESLSVATTLNNQVMRIHAYLAISDMFEDQQLLTEALDYAERALQIAQKVKRESYTADALKQLSELYRSQRDYQTALSYYEQYAELQISTRNTDNRLALEALSLAHSQYEQELESSELRSQLHLDQLQIEKMQHQKMMYNIIVLLLIVAASFTFYSNRKIRRKASIDAMTQAYSRAETIKRVKETKASTQPDKQHILILLDLDNFKSVNDEHGHPTGDRALVHVSHQISKHLNRGELFGRLGGEEFLVLLKETDIEDVRERVEEIHYAISSSEFLSETKKPLTITASFAYLATQKSLSDFDILYSVLDQALYQAKSNGRNCIIDAYNDPIDASSASNSPIVYELTQP
ncbi:MULTISPECIES: diguanylate cyclase [unclassified Vibrio]|uniref:tetratricopeptide repeat-containing diguanylate cyclase n=1 Tax=unclassified Vibrio TaxID=2614977 RepID=UPI002795B359|nr:MULTISPECIES: diguanylate cyclase [unclassified Vibrio]